MLDVGPSENSSFHVIGSIFDTVYREGHYELQPDETHGGSQALDLQPAQGGFVEFTLENRAPIRSSRTNSRTPARARSATSRRESLPQALPHTADTDPMRDAPATQTTRGCEPC